MSHVMNDNKLIVDIFRYANIFYTKNDFMNYTKMFKEEFNIKHISIQIPRYDLHWNPYEVTFNDPDQMIEFILKYPEFIIR